LGLIDFSQRKKQTTKTPSPDKYVFLIDHDLTGSTANFSWALIFWLLFHQVIDPDLSGEKVATIGK